MTASSMLRSVLAGHKAVVLLQDVVGSAPHKKTVMEAARKSESTAACLALRLVRSPSDRRHQLGIRDAPKAQHIKSCLPLAIGCSLSRLATMAGSTGCTAAQAQAAFVREALSSATAICQPAGIVLLKNRDDSSGQPRLPLRAEAVRKVVLLGPHVHSPENLLGNYYSNAAGHVTTPYEAIQVRLHGCTHLFPRNGAMHCTKAGVPPEGERLMCALYGHAS